MLQMSVTKIERGAFADGPLAVTVSAGDFNSVGPARNAKFVVHILAVASDTVGQIQEKAMLAARDLIRELAEG